MVEKWDMVMSKIYELILYEKIFQQNRRNMKLLYEISNDPNRSILLIC